MGYGNLTGTKMDFRERKTDGRTTDAMRPQSKINKLAPEHPFAIF